MKPARGLSVAPALLLIIICLCGGAQGATADKLPPSSLFGIDPQTAVTNADAAYMAAGGIRTVRWPIGWPAVQPAPGSRYEWGPIDHLLRVTARHGLAVLPFIHGTPSWLSPSVNRLPVESVDQRREWFHFLRALVRRYGPGGGFWRQQTQGKHPVPVRPVHVWQIWNEANFFYFAEPISPPLYAQLVKLSSRAIKGVDPQARLLLSGLYGQPKEPRQRGLAASAFLDRLYRVHGIRRYFDGIALHPYVAHVGKLQTLVRRVRRVANRHGDRHVPIYVTELGWGSERDPRTVSFERGPIGQARELRHAYHFLIGHRKQLRLKAVYWFTWKDVVGSCTFCNSAGLFAGGSGFAAKPAWRAFVHITGGDSRP